jgi:hypothetical protein
MSAISPQKMVKKNRCAKLWKNRNDGDEVDRTGGEYF